MTWERDGQPERPNDLPTGTPDEDRDSYETDINRQEDMYGELDEDLYDEEEVFEEEEMYEDLDDDDSEDPDDGLTKPEKKELDEQAHISDDPSPMRRDD